MEASEEGLSVTSGEEKGQFHTWLPALTLVAESRWCVTSSEVWLEASRRALGKSVTSLPKPAPVFQVMPFSLKACLQGNHGFRGSVLV